MPFRLFLHSDSLMFSFNFWKMLLELNVKVKAQSTGELFFSTRAEINSFERACWGYIQILQWTWAVTCVFMFLDIKSTQPLLSLFFACASLLHISPNL